MALVLKEGKTFNPQISNQYGVDMTGNSYYGVIDKVSYNKKIKECNFSVDIYGSKDLRNAEALLADKINFNVLPSEYDEKVGSNGITITQAYEIAGEVLTDWESDEV